MESLISLVKQFEFKWMVVTIVGVILGWVIGMPLHTSLILGLIKHATVFGIIIGIAQWLVLRRYVHQAGWWIFANTVGWPVGIAVGLRVISFWGGSISAFPVGIIAGAVVGLLTWFVLLQPFYRIIYGIVISTAGWGIGFALGEIVASPMFDRLYVTPLLILGLIIIGISAGAITGKLLSWLLQHPVPSDTVSKGLILRRWMIGLYCVLFFYLIFSVFIRDYQFEKQNQISGLQFSEFDKASSIKIYQRDSPPLESITIEDVEKIKFAKEFIKRYPDGWERPRFSYGIAAPIKIVFFDGNENLGEYGIGPDYLTYNSIYVKYLKNDEDKSILLKTLDVPTE